MENTFFVANEWEDFKKHVLVDEATEIQKADMQKAFYAGYISLLKLINEHEANRQFVKSVHKELQLFLMAVNGEKNAD